MRTWTAVVAGALCQGCLAGAVHPWFGEDDVVDVDGTAGRWVQEANHPAELDVARRPDGTLHVRWHKDVPAEEASFVVAAARLGRGMYLDVQLDDAANPYVLRPHFLLHAEQSDDVLRLRLVRKDWLARQVAEGRVQLPIYPALDAPDPPSGPRIITASTQELRAWLLRLDAEATDETYEQPLVFRRAAAPDDADVVLLRAHQP